MALLSALFLTAGAQDPGAVVQARATARIVHAETIDFSQLDASAQQWPAPIRRFERSEIDPETGQMVRRDYRLIEFR
ncbi:hypothetical protein [Parasphingopyxis sp.]|uniref:hypothetical protein n=1 Tax=Parasphingopyxis sp. TaxID=1920299 RepID=UPI002618B429|nr:hypothetical protein [Parasphingopyxis sp.]